MQPHFDCSCSVWDPNLNQTLKVFCLQLDNRGHVEINEFNKINLLPVEYRFRQYLAASAF